MISEYLPFLKLLPRIHVNQVFDLWSFGVIEDSNHNEILTKKMTLKVFLDYGFTCFR